jgi:hypothetical protein
VSLSFDRVARMRGWICLVPLIVGCSFKLKSVDEPKPELEPLCSTTVLLPLLDLVGGLAGGFMAIESPLLCAHHGQCEAITISVSSLAAAAYLIGSGYGFRTNHRCNQAEDAHRAWVERHHP